MTSAGVYAPGAGGGAYLTGVSFSPSGAGGRSKNSRDASPKKLREEARVKLLALQQVVQEPPLEHEPAQGCFHPPPDLPPSQPPSQPPFLNQWCPQAGLVGSYGLKFWFG